MRTLFRVKVVFGAAVLLVACHGGEVWTPAASRDTKDDPAQVRPGYGNSDAHLWLPLAETELAAIKEIELARKGDAHALLDLALVASGDHREVASFTQYRQRVDSFIAELKPTVDAADDWHKGFEINRAMHRVFFNGEKTELGSYSLDQARLSAIFTTGKYNCISSALLYLILARGLGLDVRGVLTPTHAFVEYKTAAGKTLEVETTSPTGFDWIHDERYFKEGAEKWSKDRGLKPLTMEEYKAREIMDPYRLIAIEMADSRLGSDETDHHRLYEISVLVAPEVVEVQKRAMFVWVNEANDLFQHKQWHTLVKLFDVVAPSIAVISSNTKDAEVLQHIAYMRYYYAHALVIVDRPDDAIAMMDEGLKTLDPTWKNYLEIRSGLLWILMDHLLELMHKKDYVNAVAFVKPRFDLCKSDPQCAENLGVIYINQSVEQINEHSWNAARATLKECVALVPLATECKTRLDDLESQHAF